MGPMMSYDRRIISFSFEILSWHVTSEHVRRKIQAANGKYDKLLTLETEVGQSNLNSGLAKTILHGTVKGKRKKRETEEEVGR